MIENLAFFGLFACQIYVISYYFPRKIYDRMQYVAANYPPQDYPKLYPGLKGLDDPELEVEKSQRNYWYFAMSILGLGIGFLFMMIINGKIPSDEWMEDSHTIYSMVQMLPVVWVSLLEYKRYKNMRLINEDSKRSADLMPRRYFDFVSPKMFALAAVILVGALCFLFYLAGINQKVGENALIMVGVITAAHLFFGFMTYYFLHGKKLDPHQSLKDRNKYISVVAITTVYTSIGVNIFLVVMMMSEHYQYENIQPFLMSIYMQMIIYIGVGIELKNYPVEQIDFDVYKADEPKNA